MRLFFFEHGRRLPSWMVWSASLGSIGCGGAASIAPSSTGDATADVAIDAALDAAIDAALDAAAESDANDLEASSDAASDVAVGETSPPITAAITVDPKKTYGDVGTDFIGLSYEKSHLSTAFFKGGNANLVGLFSKVGPSLLRIGGNSVDHTTWTPTGAGATKGTVSQPDVDGLAAFLRAANWKCLYGLNYASSTAAQAANEAAYVATSLGDRLYGFEIGNEPDVYAGNGDEAKTFTYADFRTGWESFEAAIAAAVPSATFTGPASASNYTTWTVPFAADEAKQIQLLTQHWYRANGALATSTIDLLLSPDPSLPTELAAIQTAAKGNKISGGYRFAETNSFYNGGAPGISDAYGAALWLLDYAFIQARYSSAGINLHGGGDGTGYTPIADSGSAVVGPRPEYYAMAMVAQAGPGTTVDATSTPAITNLRTHALLASDGSTRVLLINVDRNVPVHATVDLGVTAATATSLLLTAPTLDVTTGMTLGGATIGVDGTVAPTTSPVTVSGTTVTVDVPTGSALLIVAK
jgi:hypothetical protein